MVKRLFKLLLVVIWMSVIFIFSHDTGEASSKKSDGLIITVVEFLAERDLSDAEKEKLDQILNTETDELHTVNATFAWRNEIDCLLRFALIDLGEAFGINGVNDIWPIILDKPERVKIILTREKRCVGWMLDGETQIHPKYRGIKIKNQ